MSIYEDLTRAARLSLINEISVTDRLIRQLYIRAAKSIEKQIANAKQGSLTERWLISYKKQLDLEIERLGSGIYSAIETAGYKVAESRVNVTAEYLKQLAERAQIDDSFTATLSSVPTDALRAMIDGKLYTDGRALSQRIWNVTGRLEGNIAEIIQQGIAQKMDTITLARMLEVYVNPKAICPVDWHKLYPSIPFSRNIDYNALRLARTAITHVYWEAGKKAAEKNPLCKGIKWNLSNQHYERQVEPAGEDVCDQYARHDEGLGIGVFPIDTLPMPHPNCICYQTEELPNDADALELLKVWNGDPESLAKMDASFEKWKKDNATELAEMRKKREAAYIKEWLDKSAEFATMDTGRIAEAIQADPVISDDKIYRYMLNPERVHYRDFVEAGYSTAEDGERLRNDILRLSQNAEIKKMWYDSTYPAACFNTYIRLGPEQHQFVVGWRIEPGAETPRLVTCFRKDK